MKPFLKSVLLFSSLIIAVCIFVEITLRMIPNSYTYKRNLIEQNTDKIQQLIIGSSVSNCGLDPAYLADSTLNLSISGQWIRYNQAVLEKYINHLPHLKHVIWGMAYQSLWLDDTENIDQGDVVYHQIYWDIAHQPKLINNLELISTASIAGKKWVKHYLKRRQTMLCDSLGLDHGFKLEDRSPTWKTHLLRKVKEHTFKQNESMKQLYQNNLKRIRQVAELCQQKNINLHLVICPVYDLYYQHTDSTQVALMKNGLQAIAQEKGNVYLYDYFHDSRFTEDDFFDGNHLSTQKGSTKLSKLLQEDMTHTTYSLSDME